ncbi:hypothetical protein SCLCIDRAFT_1221485 [Scleroderma citrinum Foug A]|uniref:Uncharacterized protein n=1 Tax=Scleroderma citrinum Foug A TaxID=1036808 RepID=A0A0C2ZQU2_9AGAM|nr:hypothetical protein SCLCIDRAFT_1221485 [Scleroderma citrinum Foug A]
MEPTSAEARDGKGLKERPTHRWEDHLTLPGNDSGEDRSGGRYLAASLSTSMSTLGI